MIKAQEMNKKQMIDYLTLLRDCTKCNIDTMSKRADWQYAGIGDFLLRHGQWFAPPKAMPVWRGPVKYCFNNARTAAKRYNWTYVEGMANYIIPVHHAWCIDKHGNVKEVTWEHPGNLYFGVAFPTTPKDMIFNNMDDLDIFRRPFDGKTVPQIQTARA